MLAPTGSDLSKHEREGTVFAGYHYDLNFLTIHGRSRFPGLHIWLRNGQKVEVSVPVGCLLIQAGKEVLELNMHSFHKLNYCFQEVQIMVLSYSFDLYFLLNSSSGSQGAIAWLECMRLLSAKELLQLLMQRVRLDAACGECLPL